MDWVVGGVGAEDAFALGVGRGVEERVHSDWCACRGIVSSVRVFAPMHRHLLVLTPIHALLVLVFRGRGDGERRGGLEGRADGGRGHGRVLDGVGGEDARRAVRVLGIVERPARGGVEVGEVVGLAALGAPGGEGVGEEGPPGGEHGEAGEEDEAFETDELWKGGGMSEKDGDV